jgi:hypothetical protein
MDGLEKKNSEIQLDASIQVWNPSKQDHQTLIQFFGDENCQPAEVHGRMLAAIKVTCVMF